MPSTRRLVRCLALIALIWVGIWLITGSILIHSPQNLAPPISQLCDTASSARRRALCYQDLAATNDIAVRRKFGNLLSTNWNTNHNKNNQSQTSYAMQFHDAAVVCALAIDLAKCVHDVLTSGNVTVAMQFAKKPLPFRNQIGTIIMDDVHHEFTEQDAEQACKDIPDTAGRIFCEKHFIQLDDEETARHYIHMSLDTNIGSDKKGKVNNKEDAKILCASCPYRYYPQCLEDVQVLPDYHIAAHFVQLYKLPADDKVSREAAEKLCNHVIRRHACIRMISAQKPPMAAANFLSFFRSNYLTDHQASAICGDNNWPECRKDVQTMNSVAAAQLYAELLRKQPKQFGVH